MKKHIIEAAILLFVVLFLRLSILDNGFLLGFKKDVGFDIPIQKMEYQSKQGSWLRNMESGMGFMQVAMEYRYIIVGKIGNDWIFFNSLSQVDEREYSSNKTSTAEKIGQFVIIANLIAAILFLISASKISKLFHQEMKFWWFMIPIYNIYLLLRITNLNKYLIIGIFIPYINIIVYGYIWGQIAKKLQKSPLLYGITTPLLVNIPALLLALKSEPIKQQMENTHS